MPSGRIPFSILLGSTVDACHVSLRRLVQTAENCEFSAVAGSLLVVDIPFVPQWQISMVQSIQQIIEIPLSPFVFGGRCPRYAGRAVSQVPPWRRHSCSHGCSSWRTCRPWFRLRRKLQKFRSCSSVIPQLQFLNEVIDVPVVPSRSHARCVQRQVPWSRCCCSSTRSSTPCRRAEADPHGPVCSENHRDTPVAC